MTAGRLFAFLLACALYSIVALAALSVVADVGYAITRGWKDWRAK
jgi:hypothetical protein